MDVTRQFSQKEGRKEGRRQGRPHLRVHFPHTPFGTIPPIHHWLGDRVRIHVDMCLLASSADWHTWSRLAPMLYDDKTAAEAVRESAIAKAMFPRRPHQERHRPHRRRCPVQQVPDPGRRLRRSGLIDHHRNPSRQVAATQRSRHLFASGPAASGSGGKQGQAGVNARLASVAIMLGSCSVQAASSSATFASERRPAISSHVREAASLSASSMWT